MADENDVISQAERPRKELYEKLQVAAVSEVVGVVGANGPGAGRSRGEDFWTMTFTFEAWRAVGSEMMKQPLTIRRKVTEEELRKFQDAILPYHVIRIEARVMSDSTDGKSLGLLEAFVRMESDDTELNSFAKELQQPVTLDDLQFGRLTLDRRVNTFCGQALWNGESINLQLSGSAEIQEALEVARELWKKQSDWDPQMRRYAAGKLLPIKNDSWLDEDESELTVDEFEQRMTLEMISIDPDDRFTFWYDDGDLFCGHVILVSGRLADGPTDASFCG